MGYRHSSRRGYSRSHRSFGRKSYRRGYHPNSKKHQFKKRGRYGKPQYVHVSRGGIRM